MTEYGWPVIRQYIPEMAKTGGIPLVLGRIFWVVTLYTMKHAWGTFNLRSGDFFEVYGNKFLRLELTKIFYRELIFAVSFPSCETSIRKGIFSTFITQFFYLKQKSIFLRHFSVNKPIVEQSISCFNKTV